MDEQMRARLNSPTMASLMFVQGIIDATLVSVGRDPTDLTDAEVTKLRPVLVDSAEELSGFFDQLLEAIT